MKAISLWEPWATMMALNFKNNETRHWYTSYRGPLLIHAAKKVLSKKHQAGLDEACLTFSGFSPFAYPLNYGHIVCKVDLMFCEKITPNNVPVNEIEQVLGDYTPGRYMWITNNLLKFEKPIPWKGSQGFFEVPDEIWRINL